MKKFFLPLLLVVFSSSILFAEENEHSVILDSEGGAYAPFIGDESGFIESLPIIGGKNKEVRRNYCLNTVEKACRDTITVFTLCNEANTRNGQCPSACEAWTEDCGDLKIRRYNIERKLAGMD
ncbi:hypothetical protein [Pseudobdellovibrio exovorus]|uniref:Kazal-like domain-containing protein n=1 Tax=Pseudobdellovibrio exovorus JSS TaxID=1184267 RepID=M4VCI8_9BACT|nr:hypothetical protein [Pseudobdellovibrio exovorus]AGH95751.1 hypothetical protein A11Q_1535 [Pseudobdellovibrio exovorus JSS]